jgi:Flp pilus assembly protein TadD
MVERVRRGRILEVQGKYDEAIKAFDKAIEINPQDAGPWFDKGVTLQKLGHNTEADAAFVRVKELRGKS